MVDMSFIAIVIAVCAGGMFFLAFLMSSRMRLGSLVGAFRAQSLLLAVIAAFSAFVLGEVELVIVAFLIVVVKVWFIPSFLLRAARVSGASERLQAYARPATLSFVAACLAVVAFISARALLPVGSDYFVLAVSFGIVLVGLLMLISRKDMYGEGIGFFVMENGIFMFGLALTHGMPFLFEIGSFFDLLAFFILITVFTRRAQDEHASVATDDLRTLID